MRIAATETELYMGTAGWSYDDWKGVLYPPDAGRGFRGLRYLAEQCGFNTVELNNTFYRPPKPDYCRQWLRDVDSNPAFLFTAKLWRRFTHQREELWNRGEAEQFRRGIGPLVEAGRLGALLVQFPWSFRFSVRSQKWLAGVVEEFSDLPLVVEVRSRGWLQDEALDFLRTLAVGLCNIDQPSLRGNLPLTTHGFGEVGYLRLHGRNRGAWFTDEAGRDERYDHLYSPDELEEISEAAIEIARRVRRIFLVANNHYRAQAAANALQLMARLTGSSPPRPPLLAENYDIP